MDKRRSKLVICLSIIFLIILSALFIALNNKGGSVSGAAVGGGYRASAVVVNYLPVIVFLAMLILALVYCERWS